MNTNIDFATKARRGVENSRLSLDATKATKRSQLQAKGLNPDDESAMSEEARAEIEAKEDEFVSQVEEAQGVMKNVSSLSIAIVPILTDIRFSTHQNHYEIWLISLRLSWSTTRNLVRYCRSWHHILINFRLTRKHSIGKVERVLEWQTLVVGFGALCGWKERNILSLGRGNASTRLSTLLFHIHRKCSSDESLLIPAMNSQLKRGLPGTPLLCSNAVCAHRKLENEWLPRAQGINLHLPQVCHH